MGRRCLGLLLFLCTGALGGCVVDRPDVIDEGFWACSTAEDCGPDQGCAEGNVYSRDFCRPACDPNDPSTCDGVCTVTGACWPWTPIQMTAASATNTRMTMLR